MFKEELSQLRDKNLFRHLPVTSAQSGMKACFDGKEYTLFCGNDYLGLSRHTRVKAAAAEAIKQCGAGAGSAPLIAGYSSYHKQLADGLAAFKDAASCLMFGSGYLANAGAIPALTRDGDVILSDKFNHASIIDGCRLSRAETRRYRHADPGSLEGLLKNCARYRRKLIVTEGVFSMDGDIAPMPEIARLAAEHGAAVYLDDAHATGTIGKTGRGTLEHFEIGPENIIQIGTLGKALGSYGAFAAAPRDITDWLVNSARSFVFSTALPPSACAAASAALAVIKDEPERLSRLMENADTLRVSLRGLGLNVLGEGTPIIPVIIGGAEETLRVAASLMDEGFYAPAIRPPTVPDGSCRIRFTVSALHSEGDITRLVDAMRKI